MDGLLNFLLAFVLVVFAVLVLLGKADGMMAKYKLTIEEGKLKFVKYCRYDAKRARPFFALVLFLIAAMLVLEYIFRPVPEWYALIVLALVLPLVLLMELKCRKRD